MANSTLQYWPVPAPAVAAAEVRLPLQAIRRSPQAPPRAVLLRGRPRFLRVALHAVLLPERSSLRLRRLGLPRRRIRIRECLCTPSLIKEEVGRGNREIGKFEIA